MRDKEGGLGDGSLPARFRGRTPVGVWGSWRRVDFTETLTQ